MFANPCQDVHIVQQIRLSKKGSVEEFYELTLEYPSVGAGKAVSWDAFRPGQFIMIRPADFTRSTVLARPFSVFSVDKKEGIRILYQVVGQGTRELAALQAGADITVWGPLGNAFSMPADKPTLVLAGGIGIAPFYEYIRRHPSPAHVKMLFGHRPPLHCYEYDRFSALCICEAHQETCRADLDEFITMLYKYVPEYCAGGHVVACGPLPFLRTIKKIADECGGSAELSLESKMACGIGACLGCVCDHKEKGPLAVCARGPVFKSGEIYL